MTYVLCTTFFCVGIPGMQSPKTPEYGLHGQFARSPQTSGKNFFKSFKNLFGKNSRSSMSKSISNKSIESSRYQGAPEPPTNRRGSLAHEPTSASSRSDRTYSTSLKSPLPSEELRLASGILSESPHDSSPQQMRIVSPGRTTNPLPRDLEVPPSPWDLSGTPSTIGTFPPLLFEACLWLPNDCPHEANTFHPLP